MNVNKLIVGTLAVFVTDAATAGGVVPLGVPLGLALGVTLGQVLGVPLDAILPAGSVGLLLVAAVSLVAGIVIVRRKHRR